MAVTFKETYGLFIGGEFTPALSGETFDVFNPATGEKLAAAAKAEAADVDRAVKAAWSAFPQWAAMNVRDRSELLWAISDIVEENLEYLTEIETLNNGKLLREARCDIEDVVDQFRYFASCIRSGEGSYVDQGDGNFNILKREPLGVVGQIVPWNYPLSMACWKIAPAMAAGNCIVIKPASSTPLSLLIFAELVQSVIPAGVLNIVTGGGGSCGEALAAHPDIRKIAFTGSTAVGAKIGAIAGGNIIPSTLELGGKSAQILFPDCQWDRALDSVCEGILSNAGQICSAGSRAFIHADIYDEFVQALTERFQAVKVGNGMDDESEMGPVIDSHQLEVILDYVTIGKAEGARLATGGNRKCGGDFDKGYFMEPTLFADVTNQMRIAQEEIFGPVLACIRFTDEKEVIDMANDSPYGLAGSVWTQDINRGIRVAGAIGAGLVWINAFGLYPAGTSFGGYKKSGYGREAHKTTLDSYSQMKSIFVATAE
ncbi:aldehyde dehydrogenase family protein [Bacilliculturomica massiliensis]|uniref:aldehyde dehydrogenase family protein n=1 Tax=Bacilliculturomica massiliensis TaxID=1917867 RepID=UPI001030AF57|nr:aldehyde dehydrogenase family protein [Bacilliculturomica massiliensis]